MNRRDAAHLMAAIEEIKGSDATAYNKRITAIVEMTMRKRSAADRQADAAERQADAAERQADAAERQAAALERIASAIVPETPQHNSVAIYLANSAIEF